MLVTLATTMVVLRIQSSWVVLIVLVVTMVTMVVMITMMMMMTDDGNDQRLHFRMDMKSGLGYCDLEQFSFCHLCHL